MNKTMTGLAGLIMAGTLWGPGNTAARAAGLLVADGGFGGQLEQIDHSVDVTLNNGVAVTHVTQVFRNLESRQVEALYTFPVPAGRERLELQHVDQRQGNGRRGRRKERAREIYDSYKQVRRDPGLLEQKDFKTFEMRIFPIAPKADQKVMITYYQEVDTDHDRATYVYPLQTTTRGEQSRVEGQVRLQPERASRRCPSPTSKAPATATPSWSPETRRPRIGRPAWKPATAISPRHRPGSYGLENPSAGIDLITSRADKDDGFFLRSSPWATTSRSWTPAWTTSSCSTSPAAWPRTASCSLSRDSIAAFMQPSARTTAWRS
jgi:hypothetical protein